MNNIAMYSTNPFTGGRACNAMIIFNAPLGVKPVITPSRGSANHHFSGGYDLWYFELFNIEYALYTCSISITLASE